LVKIDPQGMIGFPQYHFWGVTYRFSETWFSMRLIKTVDCQELILAVIIAMGFFTPCTVVRAETVRPTSAPAFKVQSSVDFGNAKTGVTSSTTLFDAGKVFDFLENPPEITIINWQQNRVSLLNPRANEQVEMSFDVILRFQERLESQARLDNDPRRRFSADPEFDIQLDERHGQLVFTSYWLTYRIKVRDDITPVVVREFLRFSDLMVRVNCLLNQGSRLPGPRLRVNQILAEKDVFPEEVMLMTEPRNFLEWLPGRRSVIRSTQNLVLDLTPEDRTRIKQAEQWSQSFRRVNLIDYQAKLAAH